MYLSLFGRKVDILISLSSSTKQLLQLFLSMSLGLFSRLIPLHCYSPALNLSWVLETSVHTLQTVPLKSCNFSSSFYVVLCTPAARCEQQSDPPLFHLILVSSVFMALATSHSTGMPGTSPVGAYERTNERLPHPTASLPPVLGKAKRLRTRGDKV